MFIVGILTWWYGAGWRNQFAILHGNILRVLDYFSIDLLLQTLFSPFRQISAGKTNGSISVQFRAFLDGIISRFIGAFIRIIMIIIGTLAIFVTILIGVVGIIFWGLIPLLPCIGIGLSVIGWSPWM